MLIRRSVQENFRGGQMIYFGIPTFQRSEKQLTLDYLERVGAKREQIIMSVQTETDYDAYRKYENRVGRLIYRRAANLSGNANTILDGVPSGKRIIIFDDDIKTITMLENGKLHDIETQEEFEGMLRFGYSVSEKLNTIGFSVYPVRNDYYMSNSIHTAHIGEGTMLALTNDGTRFDEHFDTKCDYEMTCRIIKKYGAYPRLNMYACKAGHYTSGGCDWNWKDKKRVEEDAEVLVALHPELVRFNPRKRGEVLMRRVGGKISVEKKLMKEKT